MQLFLFVCVPVRLALAWLAAAYPDLLPALAVPAALAALSFALLFLLKLRPAGVETGGRPIWWNDLRPMHSFFYATFAYLARNRAPHAWVPLLLDVGLGLAAFTQRQCRSSTRCPGLRG